MSVTIMGKKGEGWLVVVRGFGFITRSNLMTKREAIRLAARLEHQRSMMRAVERRGW